MTVMFQWRGNTIFSAWIILILGLYLPNSIYSIRWLAVTKLSSAATSNIGIFCDQLQGSLTTKQVRFCKKHPGFMESVIVGAVSAISECQFQFRTRRWNCSTLYETPTMYHSPVYQLSHNGTFPADDSQINISRPMRRKSPRSEPRLPTVTPYPIVPAGTREAAFVHAISAAGVAHAVTRACSAGEITDCGCDRTIRGSGKGFQWSGCSDNIDFGTTFSRSFVDARERQASRKAIKTKAKNRRKLRAVDSMTQALINLHNNEAGRKVIERNMRIDCKCHGVSGSCELKTCWRAMPSFREVGELLKDKFDGATEVRAYKAGPRKLLVPRSNHYKPHTDSDLVYTYGSPDFCEYNVKIGSLGTHGRRCNRTSKGIDGCDLLCCNRGYQTWRESVVERCKCKFHWCCHVQCKTCIREIEVHSCV